jgi:hypothetical protein
MNGSISVAQPQSHPRLAKPPPTGPAPSAPQVTHSLPQLHNHPHPHPLAHSRLVNGAQKGKKSGEKTPVDPAAMYESLKSRIAALEEEEVMEEEEERKFGQ